MKKLFTLAFLAVITSLTSIAQVLPISGPSSICASTTAMFMDSTTGGTWSSSNVFVASISSTSSSGGVSYANVYGVSAGVATLTYMVGAAYSVTAVTVNPTPGAISGPSSVCIGSTGTFTDATAGGTWSCSPTTRATISSSTGVLTGVSSGVVTIYYSLPGGCMTTTTVSISGSGVGTLVGPSVVCVGSTITLTDSASTYTGGVWSSSNTAVATVTSAGPISGTVLGIASGSVIISYALSTSCGTVYLTHIVSVSTPPSAISGTTTVCAGATTTLSDATSGGLWSCSPSSVATITSAGIVSGVAPGSATVFYTVPGGCSRATATITVTGAAVPRLAGPIYVCVGSSITLTDSVGTTGGVWSTSSSTIASVASAGSASATVYGLASGTVVISYSVSGSCGTVTGTRTITVGGTTITGTISGATSVYVGATTTLYETIGGGTWSSSASSIATIDPSTGIVTGVAPGAATISYAVMGCGGLAYATRTITVTTFAGISGHVLFTGTPYYGGVKVWLITLSYPMLQAIDSTVVYCSGTSAYYQFAPAAFNDSVRVKAALDTMSSASYVPTYHSSSFYWNSATVFYHTSGTGDINKDITMISGTPTTGPGFIGGSVLTGANRGTTGGIPVAGLSMNLLDASSRLLQTSRTDAAGNYSFSNLPVGTTYFVFPDSLNYLTTPYSGISLTSSASSMNTASFIQHTISHTITPIGTLVSNVSATDAAVVAYPNPSNGKLSISWKEPAAETGSVTITDAAGREAYHTSIELTKGNGMKMIDLSNLADGLYLINIKSNAINYNNKIQIAH
jgi:hypothetical protein